MTYSCKRTDSNSDPAHDSTETETKCSNGDHVPPVLTMTGDHDQPQLARCALARTCMINPFSPRKFARKHSLIAPCDILSAFLEDYGMDSNDDYNEYIANYDMDRLEEDIEDVSNNE
jgi:hypothetical protein